MEKVKAEQLDIVWQVKIPERLFRELEYANYGDWYGRLSAVKHVENLDYNGHFGEVVMFTTDARDTKTKREFMRVLNEVLADIEKELDKAEKK